MAILTRLANLVLVPTNQVISLAQIAPPIPCALGALFPGKGLDLAGIVRAGILAARYFLPAGVRRRENVKTPHICDARAGALTSDPFSWPTLAQSDDL